MKATLKGLFSFSETETDYFKDKQDKFELVSCPAKGKVCQEQLLVINKCYVESEQYYRDKDFHRSVDTLKEAFYKTFELNEPPCAKCALHFRSTITESLENVHGELTKLTSGFFANKKHQPSCEKAAETLVEFKKLKLHESFHTNASKRRFIENQPNKKVG